MHHFYPCIIIICFNEGKIMHVKIQYKYRICTLAQLKVHMNKYLLLQN